VTKEETFVQGLGAAGRGISKHRRKLEGWAFFIFPSCLVKRIWGIPQMRWIQIDTRKEANEIQRFSCPILFGGESRLEMVLVSNSSRVYPFLNMSQGVLRPHLW
jgi:hypothetical protein